MIVFMNTSPSFKAFMQYCQIILEQSNFPIKFPLMYFHLPHGFDLDQAHCINTRPRPALGSLLVELKDIKVNIFSPFQR